jgi:hypothetical protein
MRHERANLGYGGAGPAAGAVLETLPPAYEVSCTHCGRSFALRARLTQAIHIRCAACGRLFMTPAGRSDEPEKVATPEDSVAAPRRGQGRRGSKSKKPARSAIRRKIALGGGLLACAFILGLLWPSIFPNRPRHQWDVEVSVSGGKKATFALYGVSDDRIQHVYSSFDGGPFAADSKWTLHRDEAWKLSADDGNGGFPMGIGFSRGGVPWEIRFCGEGRARVDSGGKVFIGTVVRTATLH